MYFQIFENMFLYLDSSLASFLVVVLIGQQDCITCGLTLKLNWKEFE